MAESYSTSLKITLISDGDLAGTWGDTTNTNWNLIEQAVTGVDYLTTMGDANYTLTNLNGISDEARNQVIVVPSSVTLSATRYVYAPYVNKTYIISNQSSGGQSIYIQGIVSGTPTGSPLLIPNGVTTLVYCDGANGFYAGATGSAGNFLVNGNFSVTGSESATGNLTVGGNLAVTGTSTFTGIPYGPTAAPGTSTTQLATTAFVQNVAGGLGTMSTQNANNVAITGGTINGVSGTNSGLSVGYATSAGSATNATNATNATYGTTQAVTDNSTFLATTAFVRSIIPSGIIMLWSGSAASIPSGWYLCNGSNGTPNLENQFIIGAGGSYGVGATGGSATTTLSVANLPAHTHNNTLTDPGHLHYSLSGGFFGAGSTGGTGPNSNAVNNPTTASAVTGITINNASVGSGTAFNTLPPYYSLCYIMKA